MDMVMLQHLFDTSRSGVILALIFLVYIILAWFLLYQLHIQLLVTNAFAFTITFALITFCFKHSSLNNEKYHSFSLFPIAIGSLFSLSISEYFVYFFTHYGRLQPLIAIASSAVISIIYFGAFNGFFELKKKKEL